MPRRATNNSAIKDDRWIISYADFMTLLFALFVVLYAISSINDEKYSELSKALADRFIHIDRSQPGPATADVGVLDTALHSVIDPVNSVSGSDEGNITDTEADPLRTLLAPLIEKGVASIGEHQLWFEIELSSSLLFRSGSAELSEDADMLLEQIAILLNQTPSPINVEGFTDDQPLQSVQFQSNWELSAVRAAAVVRVLAEFGVKPERMVATGYGEHKPAYSNRTAKGREKNRRVTILVARDQLVRRFLSAYGTEIMTEASVEAMLESVPAADKQPAVIEQTETEHGGILYRQANDLSEDAQQE